MGNWDSWTLVISLRNESEIRKWPNTGRVLDKNQWFAREKEGRKAGSVGTMFAMLGPLTMYTVKFIVKKCIFHGDGTRLIIVLLR